MLVSDLNDEVGNSFIVKHLIDQVLSEIVDHGRIFEFKLTLRSEDLQVNL